MSFVYEVALNDEVTVNPQWDLIVSLASSLRDRDVLLLRGPFDMDMYILICERYGFYVSATNEREGQRDLVDLSVENTIVDVTLIEGNSAREYRQRFVPLNSMLIAAKEFFETGQFAPTLTWMEPFELNGGPADA